MAGVIVMDMDRYRSGRNFRHHPRTAPFVGRTLPATNIMHGVKHVGTNYGREGGRSMGSSIWKAIEFAEKKHKGQLDDEGKDYFEAHIEHVVKILYNVTKDPDIICAGYLHDTLEDTDTTYEELVEEFNERVANLVLECTHEGKKDEYGYYFPHLKTRDGIMIKFADRLNNISRMSAWDDKRQAQYLRKSKFWKDGSDKPMDDAEELYIESLQG